MPFGVGLVNDLLVGGDEFFRGGACFIADVVDAFQQNLVGSLVSRARLFQTLDPSRACGVERQQAIGADAMLITPTRLPSGSTGRRLESTSGQAALRSSQPPRRP